VERRCTALLLLCLLVAACGTGQNSPPTQPATAPSSTAQDGAGTGLGRAVPDEGGGHVAEGTDVAYKSDPPTSGPHYGRVPDYNVYTDVVPPEYWVHNLEHGAIVVLYKCPQGKQECPEVTTQLQQLYQAAPPSKYGNVKMVATQYPTLRTPLAVLAWNRIDELQAFDQERMLTFYRAHVDKGPEDVP